MTNIKFLLVIQRKYPLHEFYWKLEKIISSIYQALYSQQKTITQTKDEFDKFYGDCAPSTSMVNKWFREICCVRTNTSDSECSWRSIEVARPEKIEKSMIFCWPLGDWKQGRLWKLLTFHKAQWFRFKMKTWGWENFSQDGCHVWTQLKTTAFVCPSKNYLALLIGVQATNSWRSSDGKNSQWRLLCQFTKPI